MAWGRAEGGVSGPAVVGQREERGAGFVDMVWFCITDLVVHFKT
jgi:hypothetical protein